MHRKLRQWFGPRVGVLNQYRPKLLQLPASYLQKPVPENPQTISLVTASLNQGEFIGRTLQSVMAQHYPALQYVIRDGGSTDATLEILKQYDRDTMLWHSEPDKGQTDALNTGFGLVNGEIMAYLNADDLLLPGALHYVANFFDRHPDVDVIYGHRVLIDEQDRDIGKWILPPHDNDILRWVDYVPQETLFWRRSLWDEVGSRLDGSFDFAMDWELLLRFVEAEARFVRVPRYLGAFRVHPQQKTSSVLECQGRNEIARLLQRSHGREVGRDEVRRNIFSYLLKQLFYDRIVRLVDFFRPRMDLAKAGYFSSP